MTTLMTTEEKDLLTRAANLMEELLETIEVSQDKTCNFDKQRFAM